ncbi:DUF2207 domain-containing protein [Pseudomonas sp. PDM11]|uniref:DUF2207 domain-containing protein n=1 Tax=Pseudomonas sp. PDM11 TaxID=2769309 RepID=UPI0017867020|nr:DUF2207 domain-containing protein [Pseudomonas sp. PDM11]MBD9397926.1 DUF2207 domain-containing protein [Pseudomonas sp. PDM11]
MRIWVKSILWMVLLCASIDVLAAEHERIRDYAVTVQVYEDGQLQVTEDITIEAAGDQISRGIFRDFPVQTISREGLLKRVGFEVLSVQRNGKSEPYQVLTLGAVERIRIGAAARELEPGQHSYRIIYRTDRQLIEHSDEDELYWNVTGNDWAFPIDKAHVTVLLPDAVKVTRFDAYTGPAGGRGKAFEVTGQDAGRIEFETSEALKAREGFTIAVAWPAGSIERPSFGQRLRWVGEDNPGVAIGLGILVLLLTYFLWQWVRVGRDPRRGLIIPLFEPPQGVTAAAAGFIWNMGFRARYSPANALTVTLTSMAIKRTLSLRDSPGGFTLVAGRKPLPALPPDEGQVHKALFSESNNLALEGGYKPQLKKALDTLQSGLSDRYQAACFCLNRSQWRRGLILAVLGTPLTLLPGLNGTDALTVCLLALVVLFFGGVGIVGLRLSLRGWRTSQPILIAVGLVLSLLFGGVAIVAVKMMASSISTLSIWSVLLVLAFAATCALFRVLLEAPTLHGRKLLNQLAGYRDYLALGESEILERAGSAPAMTIALYEQHLPYAMALGVDRQWSRRFSAALEKGSIASSETAYRPQWYIGSSMLSPQALNSNLSTNLGRATASASIAPSTSSSSSFGRSSGGASGSGSSGGGGGGGGGGGW